MFLINGVEQDTLAANDRATQFGDGCFTTARIQQGQVATGRPSAAFADNL
jgi:4-amino-4-deoxychorismate lyase